MCHENEMGAAKEQHPYIVILSGNWRASRLFLIL